MKSNHQPSLFERLQAGLKEGIEYVRGNVKLKTVDLPERPPRIDRRAVVALRRQLKLSTPAFARLLNVRIQTVELWETGKRQPSAAALRLFQVFLEVPQATQHFLGNRE